MPTGISGTGSDTECAAPARGATCMYLALGTWPTRKLLCNHPCNGRSVRHVASISASFFDDIIAGSAVVRYEPTHGRQGHHTWPPTQRLPRCPLACRPFLRPLLEKRTQTQSARWYAAPSGGVASVACVRRLDLLLWPLTTCSAHS